MKPIITVTDLTMGWETTVLLERATFEVPRGSIFAILGGSGCGKSTLLRALIGLEHPMAGTIEIDGERDHELRVGRPRYGVMFQSGALFGSMTVGENLALPLTQWTDLPRDAVNAIVDAKLRMVGLHDAERKLPNELSGGMRKRAAIARAMVLEPSLLFLDEPSAGLDPVSAVELDQLIVTLNRALGMTVVVVTHELESLFTIATDCIMLDKASRNIIARGKPVELRDHATDPRVSDFFNRRLASPVPAALPPPAAAVHAEERTP